MIFLGGGFYIFCSPMISLLRQERVKNKSFYVPFSQLQLITKKMRSSTLSSLKAWYAYSNAAAIIASIVANGHTPLLLLVVDCVTLTLLVGFPFG